jgi:protein-L-isoaspartate O-methyltransferase
MRATYSPEDNKIRIYPDAERLPDYHYEILKAAGYKWAPQQKIFIAPMWTPDREDAAMALVDDIGDEDTSLAERAEDRAERFGQYAEDRAADALAYKSSLSSVMENTPPGQPVTVGHHSPRHANQNAEKIAATMRRAVKLWDESAYWSRRAAAAIRHAKYKELPGVRQRRIKGLEADYRKMQRFIDEAEAGYKAWTHPDMTPQRARYNANYHNVVIAPHPKIVGSKLSAYDILAADRSPGHYSESYPAMSIQEIAEKAAAAWRKAADDTRWRDHYANRIAYEKAMLDEQGGSAGDKWTFEVGGKVLYQDTWYTILRVNPGSVSIAGGYTGGKLDHSRISGYTPPDAETAAKAKQVTKLPPLCNYPGDGFKHMTRAELDASRKHYTPYKIERIPATEKHGSHRVPCVSDGKWGVVGVYVTDEKRKDPPRPSKSENKVDLSPKRDIESISPRQQSAPTEEQKEMDAIKSSLAAGVQTVVANQLFPTPPGICRMMVDAANISPDHRILEPSAGTGNLLRAITASVGTACELVAVEISPRLASGLEAAGASSVVVGDFLEQNETIGKFDRIVMNPPFENGSDIKHINHAIKHLKPGGRLVAICANGPRQREAFEAIASEWIPLPPDSFKSSGTSVSTVMLVLDIG